MTTPPAPSAGAAAGTHRWSNSRLVAAAAVLFLLSLLAFARGAWPFVLHGVLSDGALLVAWLLAAAGFGSLVPLPANRDATPSENAARDGCPSSTTALQCVTAIALGLGSIGLITLGLGLAGWLNRASAWGVIVLGIGCGAARAFRRLDRSASETRLNRWLRSDAGHAWLWLLAVPTLALALVSAMAPPGILWNALGDPHGYDVVEYHLQVPREWYELGRIVPLEHNVFSFFPFNVEMHYLLAMHLRGGPWAGMYLAQMMHVGFIALTVIAGYDGSRAGAGVRGATLAGVAVASTPWTLLLAPVGYNEGGLLLFGTLAFAWAMGAMREPSRQLPRFAVGGALAGFACGAKLTGVPTVLFATAAIAAVVQLAQSIRARPASFGRAFTGPAVFVLVGLMTFAPWLIRNAAWTGNPVFPEMMPLLGRAHYSDVQVERWQRAHRPREEERAAGARFRLGWERVVADARYGYALFPLAAAGALIAWGRGRQQLVVLLLLASVAVFWLALTHLQSRFFVLAIPLAALLVAGCESRAWAVVCTLVFTVVSGATWVRCGAIAGRVLIDIGEPTNLTTWAVNDQEGTLASRITRADRVTLIGDAKAFWYAKPAAPRLRYRTVFDVNTSHGPDLISAWRGSDEPIDSGELIVIDPGELRRFADTYWQVPPPPFELMRPRPYILDPTEASAPR